MLKHFKTATSLTWKYYLWPFSLKRFAVALTLQQSIHFGLGGLLYPNIEDFLIDGGFDKQTANELSTWIPNIITPLPQDRSIGDHLFSLTEVPTLPFIVLSGYNNMFYSSGHAQSLLGCSISMKSFNDASATKTLDAYIGAGSGFIADIPDFNKLAFNTTTLHEQGHCWPKLLEIPYLPFIIFSDEKFKEYEMAQEENSDLAALHSLAMASKEIDQSAVDDYILYRRAIGRQHIIFNERDFEHDITLQLYATINGVEPPTTTDILESRKELSMLVREKRASRGLQTRSDSEWRDYVPSYETWSPEGTRVIDFYVEIVEEVLEENDLSFWAEKRAELYVEAAQYFVPSVEVTYSPEAEKGFKPTPPALP